MATKTISTAKWGDIVRAMEQRTRGVQAAAIIDPKDPQRRGRVIITYPKNGVGRVKAVAWLPGDDTGGSVRHYGWASGGGYDKATAAMGGAEYVAPSGERGRLFDQGTDWSNQLRAAGFIVVGVV